MHYVQKYLENFTNSNSVKVPNANNTKSSNNVYLYCSYYSFYSQKVLMALYEKNVDFEPIVIDITKGEQYSPWFLEINPRGEIPVLKVGDRIIPDSTRILDYLDNYLRPATEPLINVSEDQKVKDKINMYRESVDSLPAGVITIGSFYHPHFGKGPKLPFILPVREVLKSGDENSAQNLRKLAEENPKAKATLLYKAEIQDRKHEIVQSEEEYLKILKVIDGVLKNLEGELDGQVEGHWLCSEKFSIVDIGVAVLLQRLWELGLEDRFWAHGKRPLLEQYFQRVKERDSFKKTIPNFPVHIKIIITSQPPMYVGAAAVTSLGVVIGIFYLVKKLIH